MSAAADTFDPDPDETKGFDPGAIRRAALLLYRYKWWAFAVTVLVTAVAALYAWRATPVYVATATVQVLKRTPQVMRGAEVVDSNVANDVDFNTQVKLLESLALAQSAANRLTPADAQALTEPLRSGDGPAPGPAAAIYARRRIIPLRGTLVTSIQYLHPDPRVSALVANLLAGEFIAYNTRLRVEESLKALDELKDRADQQRQRVNEIANALQSYRQRGNLVSLMQSKDIVTEKLKALNQLATQSGARLKDAEVRWAQIEDWRKAGRNLSELPFIASQPRVAQLLPQVMTLRLNAAQLAERYKDKHYRLIEARHLLASTEAELEAALAAAAAAVQADFENARRGDEETRRALAEQEARSLELDKAAVEYDNLGRDFRVNEQLLESMMARMREASVSSSIELDSARILDRALEPSQPVSPNLPAILGLGAMGGILLGLGTALGVAHLRDRVRNAFDVERLLELPLLGALPRVDGLDAADKAQVALTGYDPPSTEAFFDLYSRLRFSEGGQRLARLLVTGARRNEGASFVATNLALSFAAQGQRTLLVDCDLWQPGAATAFRLPPGPGLAEMCAPGTRPGDFIVRQIHPHLDVLAAGGRVRDPARILASRELEILLGDFSRTYDRIILDAPPADAAGATAPLLPLADGVILVLRQAEVSRSLALEARRQLLRASTPVLGAILNAAPRSRADSGRRARARKDDRPAETPKAEATGTA